MPEIKKISRRNVNGMRRWRDRKTKIIHAFDPTQDVRMEDVTTLCGVLVIVESEATYGSAWCSLGYIPPPEKRTPGLPSLTTKLSCMMCLASL